MKQLTTGEITKLALIQLDLMGYECWRNNNTTPVRGRIFTGRKGVSDILGFERRGGTGRLILCECKNTGDKLSSEQKELLDKAKMCGCKCYLASVDKNGGFELKEY